MGEEIAISIQLCLLLLILECMHTPFVASVLCAVNVFFKPKKPTHRAPLSLSIPNNKFCDLSFY